MMDRIEGFFVVNKKDKKIFVVFPGSVEEVVKSVYVLCHLTIGKKHSLFFRDE